jgi:phage-related tail protein
MSRDRAILVGEHGPELALLPGGTQVIPNHASREMMRGGGMSFAGANFNFYGVQDPQGFMVQMRDYSATMERR